jgi:hypothetical protein
MLGKKMFVIVNREGVVMLPVVFPNRKNAEISIENLKSNYSEYMEVCELYTVK